MPSRVRRQHRADRAPGGVPGAQLRVRGGRRRRRQLAPRPGRGGRPLPGRLAVQAAGLHRRAKHLIVLDADSTLVAGRDDRPAWRSAAAAATQVAAVTAAAMAGEIDFADALRQRVRLLAGLQEADLEAVRERHRADAGRPHPGAHAQAAGLRAGRGERRLHPGDRPAGGRAGDRPPGRQRAGRGGGRPHGRAGRAHRRPGRARRRRWRTFAEAAGVPLARTIAVGDGANDIDMLAAAGLGIAFNAKPVVREAADAALSVPYLDAILFLLGISRREVELADRLDAGDARDGPGPGRAGQGGRQPRAAPAAAGLAARRGVLRLADRRAVPDRRRPRRLRRRRRCRSTWPACWSCSAPARPFTVSAGPPRRGGACGGPTTARSSSASPATSTAVVGPGA